MKKLIVCLLMVTLLFLTACHAEQLSSDSTATTNETQEQDEDSASSDQSDSIDVTTLITVERIAEIFGHEMVQSEYSPSTEEILNLQFKGEPAFFFIQLLRNDDPEKFFEFRKTSTMITSTDDLHGIGDKAFYCEYSNGTVEVNFLKSRLVVQISMSTSGLEITDYYKDCLKTIASETADAIE